MPETVPIDSFSLPIVRRLVAATERLVMLRLRGELQSTEGLKAWNELIAAHDDIVMRAWTSG